MLKKLFLILFLLGLVGAVALGVFLTWGYYYFTRDLPSLTRIEDYRPPAVTEVYASDGTLIAEFFKERRYPVKLAAVPELIRKCFLAAEDANFYHHQGIDPLGILRAAVKNLRAGQAKQGGSTITQQVVKNLLLGDEKKLQRKIKEAVLSYQIEHRLSKDEILEMYLNQIFFGNTAYGIKSAARIYFHKELAELTVGEGAMLAGLPKAPSRYSPVINMLRAKRRQHYVLGQMVKAGFITQVEADQAEAEEIKAYAADQNNVYHSPYYVGELRRQFAEHWKNIDLDSDGIKIFTPLDLKADEFAANALRRGLKEVDKRRGWRGPLERLSGANMREEFKKTHASAGNLEPLNVYPALVLDLQRDSGVAHVELGNGVFSVNLKEATWARRFRGKDDRVSGVQPEASIKSGDVIEVSLKQPDPKKPDPKVVGANAVAPIALVLDQTPDIEGAFVLLDPHSGRVVSMIGGYSYQRSVFNRVTQSLRQPGSSFKPIVYLTAIDKFNYTPATIVNDAPRTFRVGDEFWTPGNYDGKYMGPITLREALVRSRNLVSAEIVSNIGIDPVLQTARKLGLTSKLGRNLSISLGSSEVTPLELVRAYGVFAAKGVLFDTAFIERIVDRNGKELFKLSDQNIFQAKQVIGEQSAFIMANMMKGVVEYGTGTRVKVIGRPVAAKTGTSNDQMDAWFIGYTPQWVAGVWTGFDTKKEIGDKETGGKVAAPIWLYAMDDFLKYRDSIEYQKLVDESKDEAHKLGIEYVAPEPLQPLDFSVPDGVDPFWIDKASGRLSSKGTPGAMLEYFKRGTEPTSSYDEVDPGGYLDEPGL